MPFFTGRTGRLSFSQPGNANLADNRPVAKIRDWSLDTTLELLSTNSIDSAVNTFAPGLKGATGSATLIYYRLEGDENTTLYSFQQLIGNTLLRVGAIEEAQRVRFDLNVGLDVANVDNINDIRFDGYITSVGVSVSTGELTVVPIQFTMHGDFIEVIAPQ